MKIKKKVTLEQMSKVSMELVNFFERHNIIVPEAFYQVDKVNEELPELCIRLGVILFGEEFENIEANDKTPPL